MSETRTMSETADPMDNGDIVNHYRPDLNQFEDIYRAIHEHAEISGVSGEESNTAQRIADHLVSLGFGVTCRVGGYGVVGILSNGRGRCVMLRAEMDAQEVKEATGLPYACDWRKDPVLAKWCVNMQFVMHACGHDLHTASLLAAATLMKEAVSQWQGTLVVVFQPGEEHTGGARAMVDQGLYDIVPVPDAIFGQHSGPFQAGHINITGGPVLVSLDSIRVRMYSSLGHAANPQVNADPGLLASKLIVMINDTMDRFLDDETFTAAVTVDEIHASRRGQDWVSHVDLVLNMKTYDDDMRQDFLYLVQFLAGKLCRKAKIARPPEVTMVSRAPLTRNDASLAETLRESFSRHFGADKIGDAMPKYPCEDFPRLAAPHNVPYVFWFFGRHDPAEFEEAVKADQLLDKIPLNHSPFNAPVLRPTMQTGTDALALAALSLLSKSSSKRASEEEEKASAQ